MRLFEPLAEMVNGLLDEFAEHFLVFALQNSCRLLHFDDSTVASCEFSRYNLGFFPFAELDGEVEVFPVLFIHDFIDITIFSERLKLNR